LNNQGTIYLVSTNPLEQRVSISAQNISDGAGALITTVLPSGGLPGYSNAINNLSLTLVARDNLDNSGAIDSPVREIAGSQPQRECRPGVYSDAKEHGDGHRDLARLASRLPAWLCR
jgi:hypothetical protein